MCIFFHTGSLQRKTLAMDSFLVKKLERKLRSCVYLEKELKRFNTLDDAQAYMVRLYQGLVRQFGPHKGITYYEFGGISMSFGTVRYIITKEPK